jgi:dephospho-CoA kinase
MLRLTKIGLTGHIASGKSTALQYFKRLGAYTVNSDKLVHEVLKNSKINAKIKKKFDIKGRISRKKLAQIVFENKIKLKQLQSILYPKVKELISMHHLQAKKTKAPLFIVEVPQLFEQGWDKHFDLNVCMQTKKENLYKRSHFEDFEQRLKLQMSQKEKEKRSDFLLNNDGTKSQLKKQIEHIFFELTQNPK